MTQEHERTITLTAAEAAVLLDALDDAAEYWKGWEQQYDLEDVYDAEDLAMIARRREAQERVRGRLETGDSSVART